MARKELLEGVNMEQKKDNLAEAFSDSIDNMFEDILKDNKPYDVPSNFIEVPVVRNHVKIKKVAEILKTCGVFDEAFMCGGFVRHSCSNRKPIPATYGDVDIYCRDDETYKIINEYFANHNGWGVHFENDLSIAYKTLAGVRGNPMGFRSKPIQLIKPLREGEIVTIGTMEEVLNNFDFTVIRAGMNIEMAHRGVALVDEDFDEHENKKRLVFKKIHCPISSMHRVIKYCRKGYKINSKESVKLFLDWENRPEKYKTEIVDFLSKSFEVEEATGQLKPDDQLEINRMYRMLRVD
jgi:hypothetical protein